MPEKGLAGFLKSMLAGNSGCLEPVAGRVDRDMKIQFSHRRQTTLLGEPVRSFAIDTDLCQGIILVMFSVVCTTSTLALFEADHVELLR